MYSILDEFKRYDCQCNYKFIFKFILQGPLKRLLKLCWINKLTPRHLRHSVDSHDNSTNLQGEAQKKFFLKFCSICFGTKLKC